VATINQKKDQKSYKCHHIDVPLKIGKYALQGSLDKLIRLGKFWQQVDKHIGNGNSATGGKKPSLKSDPKSQGVLMRKT
jgi:hypothetical protein